MRLAAFLAICGLVIGAETAVAQYYPPQSGPYPNGARVLPPVDDDDFDGPIPIYPPVEQAPVYRRQPGYQPPTDGADAGYSAPRPPAAVTNNAPFPLPIPFIGGLGGNPQQNAQPQQQTVLAALPPEDQPEAGEAKPLPPNLQRQIVDYPTKEQPGTIIIDTPNTYLYLVLEYGKAMRYGVGVGREGFTWAGAQRITRMAEWPDWHPPKEMIERQPYLPRFMAGGPTNPLGARALYLGNTEYRIHGTNQPSTIGTFVSSGCIRLVNADVEDLFSRVNVGTKVVVLPGAAPKSFGQAPATPGPPSASAVR